MFTENFSLTGLTATFIRQGVVRTIRFDEGTATGGVTPLIRVTSLQGSKVDFEMKPGRIINLSEPLNGIVIRNASTGANITGKISYGDGQVTDNTTTGTVDLTVNTINALNAAVETVRPEASTGQYQSTAQNPAGVTVVCAPGGNPNGLILFAAAVQGYNSASATMTTLLAKAGAAPTTMTDGDVLLAHANLTAGNNQAEHLKEALFVEAGKGLYVFNSVADNAWTPIKFARWRAL